MGTSSYFWLCAAMFALGLLLLGLGAALKERINPKVAAVMILVGVLVSMIFMNLMLFQQMMKRFWHLPVNSPVEKQSLFSGRRSFPKRKAIR